MRTVKIAEVGRAPIFRRPFFWIIALVIVAFVLAPLVGNGVELRESLLLAAVYITLASNLNIMLGFAGYINFGSIVFFGLGGYICVYLISAQGWPLAAAEFAAGVVVSLLAFVFGLGILRLRGAFFALATIGINDLPGIAVYGGNFTPTYAYIGDGATSTTSSTSTVCIVTSGVVNFVGVGTCTLTAHATAGVNYAAVDGSAQSFSIGQATTGGCGWRRPVPGCGWTVRPSPG